MSSDVLHTPVMLTEVLEVFGAVPPGVVVDATVGGGGHARALLDFRADIGLVGLDRDDEALSLARARLGYEQRAVLVRARFDQMAVTVRSLGHEQVSGVLLDLGVSSMQLDESGRGFSYRLDGPLDMRMDRRQSLTAADVVNGYPEQDLVRVIRLGGEERFARRIARGIVAARPIGGTGELAEVVRSAIPAAARRRGGHPAKRTFQALRIEVNSELDVLEPALGQAIELLVPGGRCAVLSYHSGEDRLVKRRFVQATGGGCTCPPDLPCVCQAASGSDIRLLWRGARRPGVQEIAANRRSESARMRAVERLGASR